MKKSLFLTIATLFVVFFVGCSSDKKPPSFSAEERIKTLREDIEKKELEQDSLRQRCFLLDEEITLNFQKIETCLSKITKKDSTLSDSSQKTTSHSVFLDSVMILGLKTDLLIEKREYNWYQKDSVLAEEQKLNILLYGFLLEINKSLLKINEKYLEEENKKIVERLKRRVE